MKIEILQDILTRLDAHESVIRRLVSVLTPEQLEQFHDLIKRDWESAEREISDEAVETLQRTKHLALKISGTKI